MSTPQQYLTSRPTPLKPITSALGGFDPLFGQNPFLPDGQNMYLASQPYTDYSVLVAQRTAQQQALFDQAARLRAISNVTGADLTGLTPPNQWTPDEAVQQTSLALAKLSTVNPELAQKLAEKRGMAPVQNEGFLSDLTGLVGDVVGAGFGVFGKALDIISGSSYIIPNMFHDFADGGDFNLARDVMGGFTGDRKHNWNSVFQQMGWKGDGVAGFFRATLGFAGDVLTDPLTYLTFGAAPLTKSAPTIAKAAIKSAPELLDEAAKITGKFGDDLIKWIDDTWSAVTNLAPENFTTLLANGNITPGDLMERTLAGAAIKYSAAEEKFLARAGEVYANTFNAVRVGEIGQLLKSGSMRLMDGTSVEVSKEMFSKLVKTGMFNRKDWALAKEIATAFPGMRFRLAVPLTDFRFISPTLPFTEHLGRGVNGVRALFAGQSGMSRLMTLITKGEADWSALQHWMVNGWESMTKSYPEITERLKGWNNLGGGMYTLSEQVGKLTGKFSSEMALSRTGYTGWLSHGLVSRTRETIAQYAQRVGWEGATAGGKPISRREFMRMIEDIGLSWRPSKIKMSEEQMLNFVRYMDDLPRDVAGKSEAEVRAILERAWMTPLREQRSIGVTTMLDGSSIDDALQAAQTRVDEGMALFGSVSEKERAVADNFRAIQATARTEKGKLGQGLGSVETNVDAVLKLHPDDAKANFLNGTEYNIGLYSDVNDPHLWMTSSSTGANIESSLQGGSAHMVTSGPFGRGVELTAVPDAMEETGGATRGIARVVRAFDTRAADNLGMLNERADKIREVVRKMWSEAVPDKQARNWLKQFDLLGSMSEDEMVSTILGEMLRLEGYDAVIYGGMGDAMRVTVFDPKNVKVLDETADRLIFSRGYFPRMTAPAVREWVNGIIEPSSKFSRILWSVPELEAYIGRNTVNMSWLEAEKFIRDTLREKYALAGEKALAQLDAIPRMLEINPLTTHLNYIENLSLAIGADMVDEGMRRMMNLSRIAPPMFSNSPHATAYDVIMDPRAIRAIAKVDKKLGNTVEELAFRASKMWETQHKSALDMMQRYEDVRLGIIHGIAFGEENHSKQLIALRRMLQKYGDVRVGMSKMWNPLKARYDAVNEEQRRWNLAMANANELNVTGVDGVKRLPHPKPGEDIRVTAIDADNYVYRVEGYHARVPHLTAEGVIVGEMTVSEQVAKAKELGSFDSWNAGGLHLGDYQAALERGDLLLHAHRLYLQKEDLPGADFLIATRGSEHVTAKPILKVTIKDAKGKEFTLFREMTESTPLQARRALERDIKSIVAREVPDAAKGPIRIMEVGNALDSEIAQTGRKVLYVDDYIEPVVFEGAIPFVPGVDEIPIEKMINPKFTAHSFVDPATEAAREKLYNTLSPEIRDIATGLNHPARKSAEAFRNEGFSGLIYINSIENEGKMSIVTFDPGAIRQSDLSQAIHEMAAKGQLWVDEQGNFLTKRGYFRKGNGMKLRPLADIEQELADLGETAQLLRDVDKEWRSLTGQGMTATEEMLAGAPRKVIKDMEGMRAAAERVGTVLQRVVERAGTQEAMWAKRLMRAQTMVTRAEKEFSSAYAEAQGAVAKMLPAIQEISGVKGGMTGLVALTVPGLEGYAAPRLIGQEINRLFDTQMVDGVRKAWRQFILGPWKRWATYRWPGFHVRNLMGAWFNNLLGGVTIEDYGFAERMRSRSKWFLKSVTNEDWDRMYLNKMFPDTVRGKLTYEDLASYLADDGLTRGSTLTVMMSRDSIDQLGEQVGKPRAAAGRVREASRKYDDMMRDIGEGTEQLFRLAAWSRGMAATGGDRMAARSWVMLRHGDYSDLTDFEQNLRDYIPFYKWMRTNIPYQMRALIEQPGVYTALTQKSERYFAEAQGVDYEAQLQTMPQWMREAYSIPLPKTVYSALNRVPGFGLLFGGGAPRNEGMKFIMLDLPYKDLYMGLMDYMSAGFPVARNLVESFGFQKQMFSGRPLTGEFVQTSDWAVPFMPIIYGLSKALGQSWAERRNGTWYIQDKFENVLTAWPVYSKFRNYILDSPDEDRYVQRMSILTSAILGLSIRPADYTAAELDFYYNEVLPVLDQYRSLGVQFPTASDFQSAEAASAMGMSGVTFQPIEDANGIITGFQAKSEGAL